MYPKHHEETMKLIYGENYDKKLAKEIYKANIRQNAEIQRNLEVLRQLKK